MGELILFESLAGKPEVLSTCSEAVCTSLRIMRWIVTVCRAIHPLATFGNWLPFVDEIRLNVVYNNADLSTRLLRIFALVVMRTCQQDWPRTFALVLRQDRLKGR